MYIHFFFFQNFLNEFTDYIMNMGEFLMKLQPCALPRQIIRSVRGWFCRLLAGATSDQSSFHFLLGSISKECVFIREHLKSILWICISIYIQYHGLSSIIHKCISQSVTTELYYFIYLCEIFVGNIAEFIKTGFNKIKLYSNIQMLGQYYIPVYVFDR